MEREVGVVIYVRSRAYNNLESKGGGGGGEATGLSLNCFLDKIDKITLFIHGFSISQLSYWTIYLSN